VGDIAQINDNPLVQKALRKLAATRVPTTVSQLVMWRVSGGLDWETIAQLSAEWANRQELTLARQFVDRLDAEKENGSGRLLLQFEGGDAAGKQAADQLAGFFKGKTVMGLSASIGVPSRPEGPAVACRVRINGNEGLVQVVGSDWASRGWVNMAKFTLPITKGPDKFDAAQFSDTLVESLLGRLVRAQLVKGPRAKGKITYGIKIENASPLVLHGLAVSGANSKADEASHVLLGIGIAPRRSLIVPASEEAVKASGLKQGVRVTAADISGL
jgi:hypothetical protein